MSDFTTSQDAALERPAVRVVVKGEQGNERTFTTRFCIGREDTCEVQLDTGLVSRKHAEVVYEQGRWVLRDLGSTNGTFVEGKRIDTIALDDEVSARFGRNGPALAFTVQQGVRAPSARPSPPDSAEEKPKASPPVAPPRTIRDRDLESPSTPSTGSQEAEETNAPDEARTSRQPSAPQRPGTESQEPTQRGKDRPASRSASSSSSRPAVPDPSVSQVIARYFDPDDDRPAGDHTRMIRQAYQRVQKKQRSKYNWIIAVIAVLLFAAVGYAGYLYWQIDRLEDKAVEIFYQMKEQELAQQGNVEGKERLEEMYEGYVEELGRLRHFEDEVEQLIFKTARSFGEADVIIPAGFVGKVREEINGYWGEQHQVRFTRAVERAQLNGYIPHIVSTLRENGLPPEFFYLALQESDFIPNRVGPPTRWGRAKGMWQFIPSTAERYGLGVGSAPNSAQGDDPGDERLDWELATEAAAKYLSDIYTTPAQASGLLVIASYNWGEHRVVNKMEELDGLQGIPKNPRERNYWRFLTEYSHRMPDQTKDYVLKIFSAAVIGQNPRLFGFDMDNPLAPYVNDAEGAATTAHASSN